MSLIFGPLAQPIVLAALAFLPPRNAIVVPIVEPARFNYEDVYEIVAPPGFPVQFEGFRCYYGGAVHDLCLVATGDAPSGMGGVIRVNKGGTTYAIYLVETGDSNASKIRIKTSIGTKSIRLKT